MQQIIEFLDYKMKTPIAYESFSESWFHYLFLVLMFLMMFLGVKYARKTTTKELKKTLLLLGLLMIVLRYTNKLFLPLRKTTISGMRFPSNFVQPQCICLSFMVYPKTNDLKGTYCLF
jgi:hypothetical protein